MPFRPSPPVLTPGPSLPPPTFPRRRTLPAPGPDTLILVCGPPPMVEYAVKPAFASLGYTDAMVLVW